MKIVYVGGPYSAPTYKEVDSNIRMASDFAQCLWKKGFGVICPHLNSAHFDSLIPGVGYERYMEFSLKILRGCDVMLAIPGWKHSKGTLEEIRYAEGLGIPVYYSVEDLVTNEQGISALQTA